MPDERAWLADERGRLTGVESSMDLIDKVLGNNIPYITYAVPFSSC